MANTTHMHRRQYLSMAAAGAFTGIAGCSAADDVGSGDDVPTEDGPSGTDGESDGTDGESDGTDESDGPQGDNESGVPDAAFTSVRQRDGFGPEPHRLRAARNVESDPFALADGLVVATFEHRIGFEFAARLRDVDGERGAPIVDHHGPIEGAAAAPVSAGDYSLDVRNRGGYWTVEIRQPRTPAAAVARPPVEASGPGSDVLGVVALSGSTTVRATHGGESAFRVVCYDEDATGPDGSRTVVEDVGPVDGEWTVRFDATAWVAVDADGPWTLEIG